MAVTITSPGRLSHAILVLHSVEREIEVGEELKFLASGEIPPDCGRESRAVGKVIASLRETIAKREKAGTQLSDEVVMHNAVARACAKESQITSGNLALQGLPIVDYKAALLLMDTIIGHWAMRKRVNQSPFREGEASTDALFESSRTLLVRDAERLDPATFLISRKD